MSWKIKERQSQKDEAEKKEGGKKGREERRKGGRKIEKEGRVRITNCILRLMGSHWRPPS